MTTASQTTPRFETRHGHPALRAGLILALCGSLLAGFVVSSSRAPSPSSPTPNSVACTPNSTAHAC